MFLAAQLGSYPKSVVALEALWMLILVRVPDETKEPWPSGEAA